jgi:hypothetical protein
MGVFKTQKVIYLSIKNTYNTFILFHLKFLCGKAGKHTKDDD